LLLNFNIISQKFPDDLKEQQDDAAHQLQDESNCAGQSNFHWLL